MTTLNEYCASLVIVAPHADGVGLHKIIMIWSIVFMKHRPHCVVILVGELLRKVERIAFELFFYYAASNCSSKLKLISGLIISRELIYLMVLLLVIVYYQIFILRLFHRWSFCTQNLSIRCIHLRGEIEMLEVILR